MRNGNDEQIQQEGCHQLGRLPSPTTAIDAQNGQNNICGGNLAGGEDFVMGTDEQFPSEEVKRV